MRFDDIALLNPPIPIKKGAPTPFLDMASLPTHGRDVRIVNERPFTGSGARFQNGDTLIARITPCLENGKGAQVRGLPEGSAGFGSTEFIVVRAKDEQDADFIYYLSRHEGFRAEAIKRMEGTSGRQRVAWQQIASIEVPDASPEKRREIAAILGALDDKIEVNRKASSTLEEMARALYRSWFVDFDPVWARLEGRQPAHMDAATAALFPDSFDDDGLPVGWAEGTLSDIATLNPETHSKKAHPEQIQYVDLANTKWGLIEAITSYDWEAAPSRARMLLRSGDTIVGTVRPGNGSYSYIGMDGLTGSTGFAVLRPTKAENAGLVYLAATDPDTIDDLANLADGGAYPAVRPDVVAARPVFIAPEDVRSAFSGFVMPFIDRIEAAKAESRTIATLRDTLLPRLMSGELRVGEARELVEEVA